MILTKLSTPNIIFGLILFIFFTSRTIALKDLPNDTNIYEDLLEKYRQLIIDEFLNSENACDLFEDTENFDRLLQSNNNVNHAPNVNSLMKAIKLYKAKLEQLDNLELVNVLIDAARQKCFLENPSLLQKRVDTIIGKKQRFHSWGGKRSINAAPHFGLIQKTNF